MPLCYHDKDIYDGAHHVHSINDCPGEYICPLFLRESHWINTRTYIEVQDMLIQPWIEEVAQSIYMVCVTQEWQAQNFHNHVTTSMSHLKSPDLNH